MAKARHFLLLRRYHTILKLHPKPYLSRLSFIHPSKTLAQSHRLLCSDGSPDPPGDLSHLSTEKLSTAFLSEAGIRARVSSLADEILGVHDARDVAGVLEARSAGDLLRKSRNGFAFVELLARLKSKSDFALEVINWRRQANIGLPMLAVEYSKAIKLAGRVKNVDLALNLFHDAVAIHGLRRTCIYNALMAAYMYNGQTRKAISVFEEVKVDPSCKPTIVTYNIILSVFGRSMLVNHLESVLQTIYESNDIAPDLTTYNTVIAAYVTAWKWDKMESTFERMQSGPVKPEVSTHLLMLRGYANSTNIEKMERNYELVKEVVNDRDVLMIRAMICAYCRSSVSDRVRKIETLMKFLPCEEYRPWLNVNLIRLYAQEGMVDSMDRLILEALDRNTMVTSLGVMRSIMSSYFKSDAVDRLSEFVQLAQYAGWRLCRSMYHTKMVLYGRHNCLEEMHMVLDEMELYKFHRSKKTYLILFKAYSQIGRKSEAESIIGLMWKHGLGTPVDYIVL